MLNKNFYFCFILNFICKLAFCQINIIDPDLTVGNSYNISWDTNSFSDNNLNIKLLYSLQNSFPATFTNGSYILNENVNNTGYYNWYINNNFNYIDIEDYMYKFKISSNFNTLLSNEFEIIKYKPLNISITNLSQNNIVFPNNNYTLQWEGYENILHLELLLKYRNSWNKYEALQIYLENSNINTSISTNYNFYVNTDLQSYWEHDMKIEGLEYKDGLYTGFKAETQEFKIPGITINNLAIEYNFLTLEYYSGNFDGNVSIDLLGYGNLINSTLSNNSINLELPEDLYESSYTIKIKSIINNNIFSISNPFVVTYTTSATSTPTTSITTTQTSTQTTSATSTPTSSITTTQTSSATSTLTSTKTSSATSTPTTSITTTKTTSATTTITITPTTTPTTTPTSTLTSTPISTPTSTPTITYTSTLTTNVENTIYTTNGYMNTENNNSNCEQCNYYFLLLLLIPIILIIIYLIVRLKNKNNNSVAPSIEKNDSKESVESVESIEYVRCTQTHTNPIYNGIHSNYHISLPNSNSNIYNNLNRENNDSNNNIYSNNYCNNNETNEYNILNRNQIRTLHNQIYTSHNVVDRPTLFNNIYNSN